MAKKSASFAYTLQASDFVAGRSTVCVKAVIAGNTDGYSADDVKCASLTQAR
jgi:hypothetical protein